MGINKRNWRINVHKDISEHECDVSIQTEDWRFNLLEACSAIFRFNRVRRSRRKGKKGTSRMIEHLMAKWKADIE